MIFAVGPAWNCGIKSTEGDRVMSIDKRQPLNTMIRKPCRLLVRFPRMKSGEIRGFYSIADSGRSEELSNGASLEEEKGEDER